MGSGRAIMQPLHTFCAEPLDPFGDGLRRRVELVGRVGLAQPTLDHASHHRLSTFGRQRRILVDVHLVSPWNTEASQPQLPRFRPDGQPPERPQLARPAGRPRSRKMTPESWPGARLVRLWGTETGPISLLLAKIRLYTAPSHTETWLKRPSGGSRAARLVCSHVSGGTNQRIRRWRFPIFLCVSCLKLAFTLATNRTAGIRKWRTTFSVLATTSTSSISPRPCRCCTARCRRSAIP